ncbi:MULTISPECIES: 3-oxoacyl-[acyl-carrier-protein] reductase [Tepidanaerobacter]|uniref:3-oxoacyl-[acyl-carrier-protein] reductase n=1 Tax=Tepidanaerobacter syntrophicus TaxID=224999 RepID=A0A0U9I649_9FIRM|nr:MULTISPECIES: 3-oxoacyl-[acyl-carrier-protein] reductase [Tepidanaerobacter]GAQ26296.1 3-oxoacyl-[acyl-carrier protein] reductase [Tepidanaerobacter syntrophicus]GLI19284.1 beta-ketoacyl-ACP reductase [Tepidanaerobacter syntrophicus]GLI50082.1 beta-ketoacyl-ACP reductase [Tepidanaerobacter syntrophicus]
MNLSSKVCLVTGGSKGIGRSICIEFAKNGADIALNYSSDEKAAVQTAEEIRKLGAKVETFKTDVSDFQQVEKMVKDIYDKFGRIDILVNNAGITKDALLLRMTEKEWDKVIDVNLKGVFNTSKACVRYMLKQKQGGRIINISSIVGIYGNAGQTNYAAAKAGIIGFTKSLAKELGSRDITVNAIAPGFIRTDMTLSLLQKDSDISKNIPLKRLGNPEDVAKTAAFLASEDASYITGQVIAVDGGLTL